MNKLIPACLLALCAATPALAAVDCAGFPNQTISGFVNDDVVADGVSCTIAASGEVNGNLTQTGPGNLTVRGVVNGAVSESGDGSITIARGRIGGNVSEADAGNLVVRGGSSVNGGLEEAGLGSVNVVVDLPGVINAEIFESGDGGVVVDALSGSFEGSVIETGGGGVRVTVAAGQSFKGGVEEFDAGAVNVVVDGLFEGNVTELAGGNVDTRGRGSFKGNSEHELPGTCTNSVADFQGAACSLL
ncbi:MAG: hypothetical protein HYZ20_07475 [Burkholderiales bacterium]|nr:hypothetical protein [Burkholderiales bacterium]